MEPENIIMTAAADPPAAPVAPEDSGWTTIIDAKRHWLAINLPEIWRYRDLIALFVRRDYVAQYKQTVLGPLWFIVQPLLTTIVFTIVFGRIARIPTDGIPDFLFYLSGTVCWGYFAGCLTQTAETLVTNAYIFNKVYFPRLIIPISIVISQVLKFMIQFSLFLLFLLYFYFKGSSVSPNWWIIALPFLLVQMGFLGLGCGILVSSMTTKYRDLAQLVGFGVQLWLYATPIVYPLSQIPERYRGIFALNPMASVVENFRGMFLGTATINAAFTGWGWITTFILFFSSLLLFSRVEKTFVDTI